MQDFAPFTPELFSPTTQKINDIPDNTSYCLTEVVTKADLTV
jgi:hypothetical protein